MVADDCFAEGFTGDGFIGDGFIGDGFIAAGYDVSAVCYVRNAEDFNERSKLGAGGITFGGFK